MNITIDGFLLSPVCWIIYVFDYYLDEDFKV